jgi:hypothetical protein
MKIKKNGKVIRLTESDLKRIVKRTLNEEGGMTLSGVPEPSNVTEDLKNHSEWIKYLDSRINDAFRNIATMRSKIKK